jgi:hypothetical protein
VAEGEKQHRDAREPSGLYAQFPQAIEQVKTEVAFLQVAGAEAGKDQRDPPGNIGRGAEARGGGNILDEGGNQGDGQADKEQPRQGDQQGIQILPAGPQPPIADFFLLDQEVSDEGDGRYVV